MIPLRLHLLFPVLLSLLDLACSQFVDPYPISDCSGGVGLGLTTCPNQAGCCFGGAACCAGGCCPITAWCVNMGTADEGCCPLSDSNSCGASIASYSKPACTAGGFDPKPSVQCVSADDDWYCPPGAVCGTTYPLCLDFYDPGCGSETPSATLAPTPISSFVASPTDTFGESEESTTPAGSKTVGSAGGVAVTTTTTKGKGVVVKWDESGVVGAVLMGLGFLW